MIFGTLITEYWATENFLVKICVYKHAHRTKTCTRMCQSESMCTGVKSAHTHLYFVCTCLYMKLYKHCIDSLLLCHLSLSFCCRDISKITLNMHARGINVRVHILTYTCAQFHFVGARMCTYLCQMFFSGPLLCYKLKIQIL